MFRVRMSLRSLPIRCRKYGVHVEQDWVLASTGPCSRKVRFMGPALVAGAFLLAHLVLSHFLSGRPSQLSRDVELYRQLPEDSPVRADLLRNIEDRAKKYTAPRKWRSLVASPTTYFVMYMVLVLSVAGLLGYSALEVRDEQVQRAQTQKEMADAMREALNRATETQELLERLTARAPAEGDR